MRILLIVIPLFIFSACSSTKKYAELSEKWESEIQKLEEKDKVEKVQKNAILYIGSSSIRLWKNIEKDMFPYPAIQRGYGGAKFTDLIYFTKRLVYPHQFKAVVIFVANDIVGDKSDKTPREVLGLFKGVEKIIRKKFKNQPIYFVAITPSESRWKVWNKQREANALIKAYCGTKRNLFFLDTEAAYLNEKGQPIAEYFIADKLHQNQKGYDVWAGLIKKSLDQTLK